MINKQTIFMLSIAALGLILFFIAKNPNSNMLVEANYDEKIRHFKLPDHTDVAIYPNSIVSYPSSYPDSREIALEGEATIHDLPADKEFWLKTQTCMVKAKNAQFHVKAHVDNDVVDVHVYSGSVMLYSRSEQDLGDSLLIKSGHTAIYSQSHNELHLVK